MDVLKCTSNQKDFNLWDTPNLILVEFLITFMIYDYIGSVVFISFKILFISVNQNIG